GDALLRRFASICTATCRAVDRVARVGAAAFAVLLPSTDSACAHAVAEQLRQRAEAQSPAPGDDGLCFTVSGGLATTPDGRLDLEALMQHAGTALQQSRTGGRNRTVRFEAV
ncbi:MAG: GGDEF domain-containing protein, partial [Burkholderiaceae bacterium]